MIFYESWYEAIKDMKKPVDRLAAYESIIAYGCENILPKNLKGTPKSIFIMAKPLLDANAERKANGAKGGRPTKDGNPPKRTAGKFINFEPSGTDWDAVADEIKAAQ